MYASSVPKLWNETIESHRRAVLDAVLDAAQALAAERGLTGVTMSEIAVRAGVGRATLYKYFPDVPSILVARHQEHVAAHLQRLELLRDQAGSPAERLGAVLTGYAFIAHHRKGHGATDVSALVHRAEYVAPAQEQLTSLVTSILAEAAEAGAVRRDVPPEELAAFALHALAAAAGLPDGEAVHRLVAVTLSGLR